jgi:hypothetical protein
VVKLPDTIGETHPLEGRSVADAILQYGRTLRRLAGSLAATCRMPVLFNAARGKSARQMSDGFPPSSGSADVQIRSWWMIDLEREWPIYAIRMHNLRRNRDANREHIAVSISTDGQHWQFVHFGVHYFKRDATRSSREITLLERYSARYVCLGLSQQTQTFRWRLGVMVSRRRSPTVWRIVRRIVRWFRSQHGAVGHAPMLVDAARHAAATASSTGTQGAGAWWMVDLGVEWPLYRIRIHDCIGLSSTVASQLTVSTSRDGDKWECALEGVHFFGGSGASAPLDVGLWSGCAARFVRLEVSGLTELDPTQVEVVVDRRLVDLRTCCARHGFDYRAMLALNRKERHRYTLKDAPAAYDGRIDAFHVASRIGRFGNNLATIVNVVRLARRLGVTRIYVPNFSQLEIGEPIEAEGVTLLHERMLERDRPGSVLAGPFFYIGGFGQVAKDMTGDEFDWAMRRFVRPIFDRNASSPSLVPNPTDLAVHIRSGDIFTGGDLYPAYVQPPLSFYQLIIHHARNSLGVQRVILVYQDERNPCIGALKEWLRAIDFPCVAQSASLAEDIAVLRHSRYCVFGHGSFGPAIVCLSDWLETVFLSWTTASSGKSAQFARVRVVKVRDAAGQYMKAWRNTPEQLQMMLDYPIENLSLDEDTGAPVD